MELRLGIEPGMELGLGPGLEWGLGVCYTTLPTEVLSRLT